MIDRNGRCVQRTGFTSPHVDEIAARLREYEDLAPVVVESTNGSLDGRLMAAGLRVHRADPRLLPERPLFGSVPAEVLARTGLDGGDGLVPLERHRGTQTGREDQLALQTTESATTDRRLRAAGQLLRHGPRDRHEVALTFDDGPLPPYTDHILDILGRYGIPATFFCLGIHTAGFAEHLVRMREQGHALGNHTWSHPFLPELSRAQAAEQIERTAEAVAEASGGGAPRLFRPPYGARTPEMLSRLPAFGVTTVLWDVAPDDWAMRTADDIARDVLAEVRPGSVVLLHDGGGDRAPTVAALPRLIEGLLARGYTFVRADAMVDGAAQSPAGAV
ncbi:polysaccharide deacetylase family protein [Streptomyces xiaopingdaonensis]|uniref:polysaccharide deacetylase family protein n=1 Tax=Streptomyces xiaopingdaonensis TaxID=1565415 RepID=UPI001ED8F213|nr:polysaccharide deacetylase family protein [Streptomyces xiaopingdaonensis]